MSKLDPLWFELHDLEGRVGRIEDRHVAEDAADIARSEDRRARWRPVAFIPIAIATASSTLLILSRLHIL